MRTNRSSTALALVLALGTAAPTFAGAQAPGASQPPVSPPTGQYAPPPAGSEPPGSTYSQSAQQADRDYADKYSQWAARYCVDQHNNNTAAGALIGGVLGAVAGSGLAGHGAHAGGAILGGAVGATAGAAIGANSTSTACPPGFVVASGAPAFSYVGPAYDPALYGPAWYQPWVWVDGRWVYRPYRYWYWDNSAYWRPGWHAGPYRYHYRRW